MPPTKICISGRGSAGKDTAALHLSRTCGLRFRGSTSLALLPYVVSLRYGYPVEALRAGAHAELMETVFAHRHQERELWYRLGNVLRADNPTVLVDQVLAQSDIVCGCRDVVEIRAMKARGRYDVHLWIENPRAPHDPTLTFGSSEADEVVHNDGTLETFYARLDVWARERGLAR